VKGRLAAAGEAIKHKRSPFPSPGPSALFPVITLGIKSPTAMAENTLQHEAPAVSCTMILMSVMKLIICEATSDMFA
jgi:hypothetical protein